MEKRSRLTNVCFIVHLSSNGIYNRYSTYRGRLYIVLESVRKPMRKMPMQLKTMTLLVAILFILGVRGQLTIQLLDARTVEVNNNVVVICRDTTKFNGIQFAYAVANTAAYTDIVTCSRNFPCAVKDSTKHSAAKNLTNALYDEFTLTLISYSASFNGDYTCWDSNTLIAAPDPMKMPHEVILNKPCSSIIGCKVPHSECKDVSVNSAGRTCECENFYYQSGPVCSPIPSTAEPTTTISTSTTTSTTTTSATTDVQTTASILTAATSTVTSPTTATSTVTAPTTTTAIVTAPTTTTSIVTAPTTSAPTTATSTIIAQTTSAPTTAPITSSTSSSTTYQSRNNNMDEVGYIVAGCIGGAIVVALLIVIPLYLLRGPMCKGWRSKKPYETYKDPGAKHSSARHHRHGGNSHTRKQYERPQKSHTPDQSFPNHYNNHAYVGPAGRSSGHHVNVSKPPSYSFYDPYSGEYVRTAGQGGGHPIGQRYAPYPQSQQRGRIQQTLYQTYTPGRPGFNDNSGNWDFYY